MRAYLLLATVTLPLLQSSARADVPERAAEAFLGNGMLVVRLSTNEHDPILDIAGTTAKGVVRCYTSTTKVHDTGCYVGVKRNGALVAPAFLPKGKPGDASPALYAFAPPIAATYTATSSVPKTGGEQLLISIGGSAGAAISLYATCGTKGPLRCEDADGEAYRHGKTNPVASFTVAAGGKIR